MLRPLLEYCAVVFSSMLIADLSEKLERQQKIALKIIYGFDNSYEQLLDLAGIKTLAFRREESTDNFARKLAESERFKALFPLNEYPDSMAQLRHTNKYKEFRAKTDRLYNSPLYSMRLRLNQEENLDDEVSY